MANILVVEDIADNAELARRVLTANGHNVLVATDASTGLDMAIAYKPDAIVLDLGLPDADGQTLIGWLRRVPALAKTPIIACSAWPEETARKLVAAYKCDGFIPKPIKVATFATQVSQYLHAA
jgi:two-component system cell cycle response regulator DivK